VAARLTNRRYPRRSSQTYTTDTPYWHNYVQLNQYEIQLHQNMCKIERPIASQQNSNKKTRFSSCDSGFHF
jgi:hypothetical protein